DEAPPKEEDTSEDAQPDYESMTVPQLKELLKKEGKPVSGKKADLIARLTE
ncbi:MAG TPA: SAP domain-containing protein, partial [Candidatus Thalassarchaeaceae archaeon]|nr:SAP domain-containing protein [Candidatus Thalassarchaeaceae archaeon]